MKRCPSGLLLTHFDLAIADLGTAHGQHVSLALGSGRFLWKKGDGFVIDGFGPDGISARVLDVTRNVVKIQTGYLYHYAFAMLIGVAGLITWFMFGLGGQ